MHGNKSINKLYNYVVYLSRLLFIVTGYKQINLNSVYTSTNV